MALVFLTPKSSSPAPAPPGMVNACKCLSYANLARILRRSIEGMGEHALKQAVRQYAGICQDLYRSHGGKSDDQRDPSIPDGP